MVKLPVLSLEGCGVHEESEFISFTSRAPFTVHLLKACSNTPGIPKVSASEPSPTTFPLWAALFAIFFAQFIKIPLAYIATRKFDWTLFMIQAIIF